MNDAVLGFIGGLFCGGLLGFVVAALMTMGARETEKELDDGVDEVLDELFQTVKNQPKPYHDEERQEDFKSKYPKE